MNKLDYNSHVMHADTHARNIYLTSKEAALKAREGIN